MKQFIDINRQTKIVATISTASQGESVLTEMIKAGLNMARMNMSHGDHAEHALKIGRVRKISEELGAKVSVLVDLAGPKIRIGDFETETVELVSGKTIILTTEKIVGTALKVSVNYEKLPQEIKKGNIIFLNDGKNKLEVEEVKGQEIVCKILVGGEIRGRRGLNLPGAYLSISAITEKDKEDVKFAIEQGAEYIGVSFVRTKKDILDLKQILESLTTKDKFPRIIAKIETQEAIENYTEILSEVDGIMVARGDLAVEVPKEKVPIYQKMMIRKANQMGKVVITATQMLSSMVTSTVPTRAEVSDVANAIFDGTDAVMLSEETAVGEHPVLAVETMRQIAEVTDKENFDREEYTQLDEIKDALKKMAVNLAKMINAKAIISLTETGKTTYKISRFKNNIPIIALVDKPNVANYLSLVHGVSVLVMPTLKDIPELRKKIKEICEEYGIASKGDKLVVVSGLTFGTPGASNMMFIEEVK